MKLRALVLGREVARNLALARDLNRDLARDLAGVPRTLDRVLIRVLIRVLDLDLDPDLAFARDVVRARDLARDLERALDRDLDLLAESACELVAAIEHAVAGYEASNGNRFSQRPRAAPVQPAPLAERLTRTATRVLPPTARARYREEFRSELYELAHAGASRWTQLAYALRLLDRAWILRVELREVTMQRAKP